LPGFSYDIKTFSMIMWRFSRVYQDRNYRRRIPSWLVFETRRPPRISRHCTPNVVTWNQYRTTSNTVVVVVVVVTLLAAIVLPPTRWTR
jgi:hypothetical protein